MKTQKVTKSSKFTQVTPNDKEYQNIGLTVLPVSPSEEANQNVDRNPYTGGHSHNNSSELLLRSDFDMHEIRRFSPECNTTRFQQPPLRDPELCNCITPIYGGAKARGGLAVVLDRSFASQPKLEAPDERAGSKVGGPRHHSAACEQNRRLLREGALARRVHTPEIINTHRGGFCEVGIECADRGLRRGHSVRSAGSRSMTSGYQKRRPAGDGMDSEMDDPDIAFEMSAHLGERQCPCDHVVYSPTAYGGCLQVSAL